MTTTTNGRTFIYAVFDADGYECSDFVAAFSTQDKAEAFAARLRDIAAQEWDDLWSDTKEIAPSENRRTISVQSIEVDKTEEDSRNAR